MSDIRRTLEKRLEILIPKKGDDLFRRRAIKDYVSTFSEDVIPDILEGRKPLYFDLKKCEWVYLPK